MFNISFLVFSFFFRGQSSREEKSEQNQRERNWKGEKTGGAEEKGKAVILFIYFFKVIWNTYDLLSPWKVFKSGVAVKRDFLAALINGVKN